MTNAASPVLCGVPQGSVFGTISFDNIHKLDFILKDGRVTVSTVVRNHGAFFDVRE